MSAAASEVFEVLVVDDNPADADLTRETFRDAAVRTHLSWVGDGVEAIAFLRREGRYADAPRPDLILLDLNMPRMDGRDVLRIIKHDPELRRIPVVVLTTSQSESDIAQSYDLHANCFVTKPVDFDQFVDVTRTLERFWFGTVRLSPQ